MLDIKFIRRNPEIIKEACKKKNVVCDVDKLLEIDQKKLKIQQEIEGIAAEKNKASKTIPQTKDALERENIIKAMKILDERADDLAKNKRSWKPNS